MVCKTYWVFTDASLYELVFNDETRDIWRKYLSKGMYEEALNYAKVCIRYLLCSKLNFCEDYQST